MRCAGSSSITSTERRACTSGSAGRGSGPPARPAAARPAAHRSAGTLTENIVPRPNFERTVSLMAQDAAQAFDDGQAEPMTAAPVALLVAELGELLEDLVELLARNAGAVVPHFEPHRLPCLRQPTRMRPQGCA